jgi:hypothetical protein
MVLKIKSLRKKATMENTPMARIDLIRYTLNKSMWPQNEVLSSFFFRKPKIVLSILGENQQAGK